MKNEKAVEDAGFKNTGTWSRRQWLKAGVAAVAAPVVLPGSVLGLNGATAPSERLTFGVLGLGDRGTAHTGALLGMSQTQLLAVCDPYQTKVDPFCKRIDDHYGAQAGKENYKACQGTQDFREVLARDEIDGIFVAAPEYWHSILMAESIKAGKDVYGEKALTLTVAEGQKVVETVRRYGRVFQVGTQQRSSANFRHACELARNGYLGKLHTVKVGVPGGRELPEASEAPVPKELDYDMWLGPAPWTPYNELKCTFNWYFIYDYCVGWIQSWGVHHIDIALWGAPELAQGRLEVSGEATFPKKGIANTSITWNTEFKTASGLRLSFTDNTVNEQGCRFEGDEGWVHVNRSGIKASSDALLKVAFQPGDERLVESRSHHQNFLDCIASRRDPVSTVESGHQATVVTLVADIATRLKQKMIWDWKDERFADNEIANRMLSRPMRSPWRL